MPELTPAQLSHDKGVYEAYNAILEVIRDDDELTVEELAANIEFSIIAAVATDPRIAEPFDHEQ